MNLTDEILKEFEDLIHGFVAAKRHEEQWPIIKEGEAIIDPIKFKAFLRQSIDRAYEAGREAQTGECDLHLKAFKEKTQLDLLEEVERGLPKETRHEFCGKVECKIRYKGIGRTAALNEIRALLSALKASYQHKEQ